MNKQPWTESDALAECARIVEKYNQSYHQRPEGVRVVGWLSQWSEVENRFVDIPLIHHPPTA